MVKVPWLQKPYLHLDLLPDTQVRSGTWSDLTCPPIFRDALQFLFYEIFTVTHPLGCTDPMTPFLGPPDPAGGGTGLKVWLRHLQVGMCLCAKFQPWRSNSVAAYPDIQTHKLTRTQTFIIQKLYLVQAKTGFSEFCRSL